LVVLVQIQIDIFMFSVSFVIVMFYCFFKERTWRLLRTPPRRNDFGFNTELGSVFAFVIYSFIEEILKPDPRKNRKSSASADTDPDEPEQKMDYSGEGQQQRTLDPTNQQLTRWFMDTLRNDNNRTDDENRRDNVVAIRDVLAYSSQLELTDAVGAEVQEPDQKRWKLPTFYSVLEQTRIEVIHRGR
jgi:hypothetical protein